MTEPVSRLYAEDGELWLRVNHGHAVSERWLRDHVPDLYAEWWAAPTATAQDALALRIEQRVEEIEGPDVSPAAVNRMVDRVAAAESWERLTGYEATAVAGAPLRARIVAAMSPNDPQAALKAEVLLAVAESGYDLRVVRSRFHVHGTDLGFAPRLLPANEFYERHCAAIHARLDREIAARGFRDLRAYMASWAHNRPASPRLHDLERAIVDHTVVGILDEVDGVGKRELRTAERLYEAAQDRVLTREWSEALERGEVHLTERALQHDEIDYDLQQDTAFDIEQDVR